MVGWFDWFAWLIFWVRKSSNADCLMCISPSPTLNAVTGWTARESVCERARKVTGWLSGYTSVIGVTVVFRGCTDRLKFSAYAGCIAVWLCVVGDQCARFAICGFAVKACFSHRSMPAMHQLSGESTASRSVIHLTRLETRTKESNMCASHSVLNRLERRSESKS